MGKGDLWVVCHPSEKRTVTRVFGGEFLPIAPGENPNGLAHRALFITVLGAMAVNREEGGIDWLRQLADSRGYPGGVVSPGVRSITDNKTE